MVDLSARYLGLHLCSPIVASASPATAKLESLRRLEDAGIGAVVLPSLFEEEITHDALEIDRFLNTGEESSGEAHGYFPELHDYDTVPSRFLQLVEDAKRELTVPVIPSLNGVTPGGWISYARRFEDAGADALELNAYFVAAAADVSGERIEQQYVDLVEEVRSAVEIPLAVKVGPYFSSFATMARRLAEAGADGLVLFNRFYQPDLDLETLSVLPRLVLSTSDELRLPLRWIAILRHRLDVSLAATTGVHTSEDVLKALLAGADVTMMASALLRAGPAIVTELTNEIRQWLDERDYESVQQLTGSVSQEAIADPSAYERSNYYQVLHSYSSPFPG